MKMAGEKLTSWAVALGMKVNGIETHRFTSKGIGIVAERDLQVCEIPSYQMQM
jgi:hypothetical protein